MTQYLISVFHDPGVHAAGTVYESEEALQAHFARVGEFNDRLQEEGRLVFVGGLTPPEEAQVVDGTGGDPTMTEGPMASGGKLLGGLWVVEAEDAAEAGRLAVEASAACGLPVELRSFAG